MRVVVALWMISLAIVFVAVESIGLNGLRPDPVPYVELLIEVASLDTRMSEIEGTFMQRPQMDGSPKKVGDFPVRKCGDGRIVRLAEYSE